MGGLQLNSTRLDWRWRRIRSLLRVARAAAESIIRAGYTLHTHTLTHTYTHAAYINVLIVASYLIGCTICSAATNRVLNHPSLTHLFTRTLILLYITYAQSMLTNLLLLLLSLLLSLLILLL